MKTRRTGSVARLLAFGGLVAVALAAPPAEARLLDLRAGALAGGITGWGTTANTPDFFERKRGPGLGVEVGARLLVFDFSVNFTQLFDGNGRNGTFTQALVGLAFDVPVGNQVFAKGDIGAGKSQNVIRPIVGVGFGIGTPEPISGQLDNAQISDKGLVTRFGVGYEHFFNPFISAGYHLSGFGTFTFHLGL